MSAVFANFKNARDLYFRAVRDGKPTSAAKAMALAVRLGSHAEVVAFIREAEIRMGKQDYNLLPETTWKMDAKGPRGWNNEESALKDRTEIPTHGLLSVLSSESVSRYSISWPSVTDHWGVSVFWSDGDNEYRAFSADYATTETHESM